MPSPEMLRPEDVFSNPYSAPTADLFAKGSLGDGPGADETIRRAHLGREASVRSLGSLYLLSALIGGVLAVGMFLAAAGVVPMRANQETMVRVGLAFGGGVYLILTGLSGAVGIGLHKLRPWARWTAAAFGALGLLSVAANVLRLMLLSRVPSAAVFALIGGGFNGYILYLLLSAKAAVVFSRDYREVITRTPHIRPRTSRLLIALVAVLGVILILALIGAILRASL